MPNINSILKIKTLLVFNFIFIVLGLNKYSYADCERSDIQITSLNPSIVNFNTSDTQNVNINITHGPFSDTRTCVYAVVIDYGQAVDFISRRLESFAGDTLSFNVHKNLPTSSANIIRNQQDVTSNNQILINPYFLPSGSSQTQTKSFVALLSSIPSNLVPGIYVESLVLKVVARPTSDLTSGILNWVTVAESAMSFIYQKPSILEISIVDSAQPNDIMDKSQLMSFGKLSAGLTQSADVMIDTNIGYRLSISSINDGVMKHQTGPDTIPYTLSVNGSPINLTNSSLTPVNVSSEVSASPIGGYRLPINVIIGAMTNNEQAGIYSDTVIFRAEAF